MSVYVKIVLFMAGGILFLIFLTIRNNRKRRKMLLKMVRRRYGQIPDREYEAGEISRISHYHCRRAEERKFVIDDITWNDLDLDKMFMLVNQTISSPGEDVLYDIMRTPVFSEEVLQERDKLIEFFRQNPEKREKMQLLLAEVGRSRFGSLSDTIFALDTAPKISLKNHGAMLGLLLCSIAVLFAVQPLVGFFMLLALSMGNFIYYFAGDDKKHVDLYMSCFASLLRILRAADKMETVKWPEVANQMESIREGKNVFRSFKHKAVWLAGANDVTSDNPGYIFMDVIRMLFHVDFFVFNSMVDQVREQKEKVMLLIDTIGELDAMISIASYRDSLPLFCKPELHDAKKEEEIAMDVQDLYHPVISEPVANSICARGGTLVTGSNASGKSTFLKITAINAVMAQTLYTCTCTSYEAPYLKVMTSMALRDDLDGGESYFIVEIKSLKRILDECEKREPLLCVIDEVLRGTNTIERIAASSEILRKLRKPWMLPFAATHDIELSYILENFYENYHFEEEIRDKDVLFNYLLMKGRATSRNAIALLDVCGYDAEIVDRAKEAARRFEETGQWEKRKGE